MTRILTCVGLAFAIAFATASAQTTLVSDVRAALGRNDVAAAEALVTTFRQAQGTTPEALEALSWLGRGAFAAGDNARAISHSQETRRLVVAMLPSRRLDADPHLSVALGAAIETEAKAMAATGQRASAVLFLRQQLDVYRSTPIRARLQKNINLLGLEGQPAPPLTASEHLGAPMPKTTGRPVRSSSGHTGAPTARQAPIVADLQATCGAQGLVVSVNAPVWLRRARVDVGPPRNSNTSTAFVSVLRNDQTWPSQ